jgi:hypothetical protein
MQTDNVVAEPEKDQIWRDKLKESRGKYFVEYDPADSMCEFATINLIFPDQKPKPSEMRAAMEREMKLWLKRFKVPVIITSFDATDSKIHLPNDDGKSTLMAYVDPKSEQIVKRWGFFENGEMPIEQMSSDYHAEIYRDVAFRRAGVVRKAGEIENKRMLVGLRIFKAGIIFVAAVPVAIELICLGIGWLSATLQGISLATGAYKIAKAAGWVKKSAFQKEEDEKQSKMKHYYYHCSRNPEGFERLKIENFKKRMVEKTRTDAVALAKQAEETQKAAERVGCNN